MNDLFRRFAERSSIAVGSSWAFLLALMIVIVWAISGPVFHFSAVWQLVINTGTTIITFLMIFLVQNTQNRETKATQLKLDELIRAQKRAHNALMGIETKSDKQLDQEKQKEMKEKRGKTTKRSS
jgi:low affinity Fe/Cu permease